MLRKIQGARVGRKTALIVIAIALAVWAVVVYANVTNFVPEELTEPIPETRS